MLRIREARTREPLNVILGGLHETGEIGPHCRAFRRAAFVSGFLQARFWAQRGSQQPQGRGSVGRLSVFGDDVDSVRPLLSRAGASKVEARPAGRSFTDWRVHDPEGNPIDLSARGYNTIPAERLQNELQSGAMSEVRRLVILSQNPQELARFYIEVFGMETVKAAAHKVVLTDDVMQLVLLNLDPNPVNGLYCYGLAGNENCAAALRRFEDSKLAVSWGPDWVDEGKRQMHLRDPEENLVCRLLLEKKKDRTLGSLLFHHADACQRPLDDS